MRSTHLRAFHAVAAAGGFVAAGRKLNVSQPTLTAHVASLEGEFSVELFYRRKRRTELTPAGRELFAITTRMFAEEQDAREFLNESKGLNTGKLRIGAVGPFHGTKMLAAFNRHYPGIQLSVSIGNSWAVQQELLDYKTDVAVLAHIDDDARLLTIPYRRHPIVAFVRTDHRLARRRSIPLAELHGERIIVRETGSTTRRAFETATRARGIEPEIVMEIGSREAIREAVIRGLGISYVSEAEFIPDPSLVAIPISDAEIYTYAHVAVLAERRNSRLIAAFLGIVQATLAQKDVIPAVRTAIRNGRSSGERPALSASAGRVAERRLAGAAGPGRDRRN